MAASDGASSISVTVRVRPFTIREAAQLTKCDDGPLFLGDGSLAGVPTPKLAQKGIRPVIKVVDDKCLVFDPPEDSPVQRFSRSVLPQGRRVKDQTFGFDKIFDENTTQGDVYEATTRGLLDSVLDGYNATVFAYGATGCGKTHTITGTAQHPGIIFLTMQELFERIADVQGDKATEISLSYLEIYNETIRDLLVPGVSKGGLMLREDANQAVSVAGLSSHHPANVQEVMDMIVRGNELRTMSPTEANATSSRSHAVLQINVSQKDRNADVNEPHTMATLSIIDLAGSERASATKNRGERLIEGANINRSLLALGSCINALCDPRKRNHVPYRNSKLTRLLKFSLGGNCRTVMIVCVSPSSAHFDETQNTLRYANRAKNIQTKVTRNVYNVNRHVKDFLKKIDEQMTLINELKQQQKEQENLAFTKFRRQSEKREAILREGIARLRSAYDHSMTERQEHGSTMKKLRQLERRIAQLSAWLAAFDGVCDTREDEEPPRSLTALRKTAQGILVELEGSRQHYHQKHAKNNWHRALDTALQIGIKQLQEADGASDGSEMNSLTKEAELLKSSSLQDLHAALLDQDKTSDMTMVKLLLHSSFETAAIVTQLLSMDEQDAVRAARNVLGQMLTSSIEASSHIIRPDGSMPIVDAVPPLKSGTPKRRKNTSLMGPSPLKTKLPPLLPDITRLSSSPLKTSPRRRRLGSAKKGISFTPKRKSPAKRAVRWRDDTEDGALAEYEKTPQAFDSTPEASTMEVPSISMHDLLAKPDDVSSSPIPLPPQPSSELRQLSDRFKTGFLSRKSTGSSSPAPAPTTSIVAALAKPAPLQEVTNNGGPSREVGPKPQYGTLSENYTNQSSSDSENGGAWRADASDAKKIKTALKRASLSRSTSFAARDPHRVQRRRSPPPGGGPSSGAGGSPPPETSAMFTGGHARRMVRAAAAGEDFRASMLSPRNTPVVKAAFAGAHRRTTIGEDRQAVRPARVVSGKMGGSLGKETGAGRPSILGATKGVWR